MGPSSLEKRSCSRRGRSKEACVRLLGLSLSPAATSTTDDSTRLFRSLSSFDWIPGEDGRLKAPLARKHQGTLVSRGMPVNQRGNRAKQTTRRTSGKKKKHTRRYRNAKNLLPEWNPVGNNGPRCTLSRCGLHSRIELYSWFTDCFQWLTSISDASFRSR